MTETVKTVELDLPKGIDYEQICDIRKKWLKDNGFKTGEFADERGKNWTGYTRECRTGDGKYRITYECYELTEELRNINILVPVFDTSDLIFKNGRDTEPIVARHD